MEPAQSSMASLVIPDDVAQTKMNLFVKELKDLGLPKEEIETITIDVAKTATNQTTAKISLLMSDEDFSKWKAFMDSTPIPNAAQQGIIMNKYLQDRVGKNLETLYMEILEGILKDTLDQLHKTRDISIKMAQLSDEEVDAVNQALDDGDIAKADDLINKFNDQK